MRCGACAAEYLVAFSCKGRGLCPSSAATRTAELAAFLREEVLDDVGHAQWVFSIPKMLRPFFLAFITEPRVIGKILRHLAAKGVDARSPPGADPSSSQRTATAA